MKTCLRHAFAAFLLYAAAAAVRITGIAAPDAQVDEIHWRDRSYVLLHSFKDRKFTTFSSHLAHPGVAPSLIMAAGQETAQRLQGQSEQKKEALRIDSLSASRLACALFSSLAVPLLYLGLRPVWGSAAALASALFLAVDVQHLAVSRLAHLDGVLSVFTAGCILAYFYAVIYRSAALKLLSGVMFGLGLATKFYTGILACAFLIFKALRSLVSLRSADTAERSLITWGDIGALLAAHCALAVMWTRLWHPSRAYWSAKGINSPFADSVYALAQSLNQHVLGVFVLALLLAAPGLCCARLARRNEGCCAAFRKASPGLLVFAGIICALGFFPHTIDGILRYWMRGAGLAKVAHVSFGWTWPEPEFGYIGMILSRYPSVVTVLMFAGAAHGIYSARSLQRNNPRALWLLLLILSSIAAWVALLSISSKQAVRYLVPVSPLFSALAGYGLVALLELVSRNRRTCSSRVFAHAIHLLSTAVPLIIYFFSIRPLHPDYLFFYNSLSGGLSAARDRGLQLPTGGLSACLAVLEQEANRAGRRLQVALVADQDVVSAAYRRHYPNSHALQFVPGGKMRGADFVLVSESLVLMFREQLRLDFANLEPVYSYRVDGVDVTTVSRVLPGEFKEAAYLPLSGAHHHTGKLARLYKVLPETPPPVRPSDDALLADSQKHKAGYLFFGEMLKVSAGNYEFKFYLGLPAHLPVPGALPQTEVLRIEAGPKCERRLRLEELPPASLQPFSLECAFEADSKIQLRGYWSGAASILAAGVEVKRRPAPSLSR